MINPSLLTTGEPQRLSKSEYFICYKNTISYEFNSQKANKGKVLLTTRRLVIINHN